MNMNNNSSLIFELANENTTILIGESFSKVVNAASIVFISGVLGAGKTTFVRGFLRGKGYFAKVKSPTYTMVESYDAGGFEIHHLDLYRLNHPRDLDYIGLRDYAGPNSIIIIEWPEKGKGHLPEPDLIINLDYFNMVGRKITFTSKSLLGKITLDNCKIKKIF